MEMTRDQLEFAISQYIDGTLPPVETAALEERLARDPEARAMLDEYRRLDEMLKAPADHGAVQWDTLSERISSAVGNAEAPATRVYTLAWVRRVAAVAVAACAIVGLGIWLARRPAGPDIVQIPTPSPINPTAVAIVEGPRAEVASAPAVMKIEIGPPPETNVAQGRSRWRYAAADSVVSRPSRVVIASAMESAQDTDQQQQSPY